MLNGNHNTNRYIYIVSLSLSLMVKLDIIVETEAKILWKNGEINFYTFLGQEEAQVLTYENEIFQKKDDFYFRIHPDLPNPLLEEHNNGK